MSENNYLSLDSSVLYRCNQKHFDKLLDKYGIGYTQLILLTQIYEQEGISMNELAVRGVFDKGTITKSIQRLEQLSYVRIENSEVDKRSKLLYTTEETQQIMPDLYEMRSKWKSYLSTDISSEELDVYNSVSRRLIEKARAYVGIKKLDGYILHELISAIYVSAPDKSSGYREQHIRIEYNGIGFIPIHELMAKQTA